VIRIAHQCVNAAGQPYDEETMEVLTILGRFENHQIVDGGREQYEARLKLVDYILERKAVTEAGCRFCPHCLTETPTKFSVCVGCWTALESHGIRPYRLDDPVDEEDIKYCIMIVICYCIMIMTMTILSNRMTLLIYQ